MQYTTTEVSFVLFIDDHVLMRWASETGLGPHMQGDCRSRCTTLARILVTDTFVIVLVETSGGLPQTHAVVLL